MKPLFTEEEFEKAGSYDKLKLECKVCKNIFEKQKRIIGWTAKNDQPAYKNRSSEYCSSECFGKDSRTGKDYECTNCKKIVYRAQHHRRQIKNVFCSRSCAATYNNLHKTKGNRRSKLEEWLEIELNKEYEFEILYNDKTIINAELDIFIPSLNLAIELNGIYHYEPIHGEDKLKQVKNNDGRKFQACIEHKIELCIIDSSGLKYNKPEKFMKFLNIINEIIKTKLNENNDNEHQ